MCIRDRLELYKDKWNWKILTRIESLPWSESLIERYADKWVWAGASEKTRKRMLDDNETAIKLFNSWTKQEISTALERIKLAANRNDDYNDPDDIPF